MGTFRKNIWYPSLDGKASATIRFRDEKATVFLNHKTCTWRFMNDGIFGEENFETIDAAFDHVEHLIVIRDNVLNFAHIEK